MAHRDLRPDLPLRWKLCCTSLAGRGTVRTPAHHCFHYRPGNFYGATGYGGQVNSTCIVGFGVVLSLSGNGKYYPRTPLPADQTAFPQGIFPWIRREISTALARGSLGSGIVFKITP